MLTLFLASTARKVSVFGVFLVRILPDSDWYVVYGPEKLQVGTLLRQWRTYKKNNLLFKEFRQGYLLQISVSFLKGLQIHLSQATEFMPKESPKNPLKYLGSGDYFVRVNIRHQQKVAFSTKKKFKRTIYNHVHSAQSSCQNENFVNTRKKLLKNRN